MVTPLSLRGFTLEAVFLFFTPRQLARNKLLNIQLETIAKRLEALEFAQLSANTNCNIREQAHESDACKPESLGFSEEHVKYMGNYPNFSYRSNNVLRPPQTNRPPRNSATKPKAKYGRDIISKFEEYPSAT